MKSCSFCGKEPLRQMMIGQVYKNSFWVQWFSSKPKLWAIICRDCHNIIGYEDKVSADTAWEAEQVLFKDEKTRFIALMASIADDLEKETEGLTDE